MIVEERIYTLRPGATGGFMKLLTSGGADIQAEHLGKPFGYFTTEFGPLNQIVHMWCYRDLEDRAQRRAALQADPRWDEYRPKLVNFIENQENKLLVPAPFAPIG